MKPALTLTVALALVLVPASAQAQRISGPAVAVDGDTLDMTGFRVRLFGIDAVEAGQTCARGGEAWACGDAARALLGELVSGETIDCEPQGPDGEGTLLAVCRAGRVDLAAAMAGAGFAVRLDDPDGAYLAAVDAAKAAGAGIWASEFDEPAAWRAANPRAADPRGAGARAAQAEPRRRAVRVAEVERVVEAGPYYPNCDAARAAGAAPLRVGQPGYRPPLDRDGDGVACEPYRGRR